MTHALSPIVIAGTNSGVGKTSISIGLARAFARRGLRVQTFKVGPDFLDPTYLAKASGRTCYNLDSWMCGRDYIRNLFHAKTADADIALIEGVMGLFDGASPDDSAGSTAEIAQWLNASVVLVANAKGMARSFAAMISGYHRFEPGLSITGVIANQCGSQRHVNWLSAALASASLPSLIGAIPHGALSTLPSRHLGLVTADHWAGTPSVFDKLADALEAHLDLDAVRKLGHQIPPPRREHRPCVERSATKVRIGIAQDSAFHFYYPDNLEALAAAGAELVPFSPVADSVLPDELNALYIGGGYPEEYAAPLTANGPMRSAINQFSNSGGAIYAECGGLMYLSQGIETRDGNRYAMAGVLPVWTRMRAGRKALGYVEATLAGDSILGRSGDALRGHEFHYSEIIENSTSQADWRPAYEIRYRRETKSACDGFLRGRVMASYVHIHFGSHPGAAESFINFARHQKNP